MQMMLGNGYGFQLLLMPTLPIRAAAIRDDKALAGEIIARALEMTANTTPFDITGDPAMSLPCRMVDLLPVGVMPIGRPYAEKSIYQAAHAYEEGVDWRTQ